MDNNFIKYQNEINKLEKKCQLLQTSYEKAKADLDEVQEERTKYKLISEYASDWEFWLSPKGHFLFISPSCKNLTGYSAEEFLRDKMLWFNIIHPEDQQQFIDFIKHSLDFTIIGKNLTFKLFTRTKQIKWCELCAMSIFDDYGKYLGLRGSIRDVTRLMSALGKIKTLATSNTHEERVKNNYKDKAESKDRELMTMMLTVSNKNELLLFIKKHLSDLVKQLSDQQKKAVDKIISHINKQAAMGGQWDEYKLHFEKNHSDFFQRLFSLHPKLTPKDLKLCSYLRLNLSTKEIAVLLNITPQSAEISRVRLRKKMGLMRKDNLTNYISRI